MLGILLAIYFIIKPYNTLAKKYGKDPSWPYALLGMVVYYGGLIVGGFGIGIVSVYMDIDIENTNDLLLGLMAVPIGAGICYGVYAYLKKKWESEYEDPHALVEEIGLDRDEVKTLD